MQLLGSYRHPQKCCHINLWHLEDAWRNPEGLPVSVGVLQSHTLCLSESVANTWEPWYKFCLHYAGLHNLRTLKINNNNNFSSDPFSSGSSVCLRRSFWRQRLFFSCAVFFTYLLGKAINTQILLKKSPAVDLSLHCGVLTLIMLKTNKFSIHEKQWPSSCVPSNLCYSGMIQCGIPWLLSITTLLSL